MNTRTITAVLPHNLKEKDHSFFTNRISYQVKDQKVRVTSNAFVSHEGLCLQKFRLIPHSTFNMVGKEDRTFYWQYYKLVFEQWAVSKFGSSLPSVVLDDQAYFVIHTKWFNYSFWITSSLWRLLKLEMAGHLEKAVLIYPEAWDKKSFVVESLKAFPSLQKKVIPDGNHMFVKKLVMPEVREWTASLDPKSINLVRERMYKHLTTLTFDFHLGDKIYLSREKAGKRMLENEEEVQELMKANGFTIVNFEDYTFWEQVYIMKEANYFVSIHGAGMANLNFMNVGGSVLEFVNRKYAEIEYTFPYWRLSNAADLKHFIQFGNPKNPSNNKLVEVNSKIDLTANVYLVDQNIVIDLEELQINLSRMLAESTSTN